MKPEHDLQSDGEDLICPLCSSAHVFTTWEDQKFDFREDKKTVTLMVHLPIRRYDDCSFEFLDVEAENIKEMDIVLTDEEARLALAIW